MLVSLREWDFYVQYVVDAFLDLAKISESDVVYDLGCNDGEYFVWSSRSLFLIKLFWRVFERY